MPAASVRDIEDYAWNMAGELSIVPAEIVEESWLEVGGMSPQAAAKVMKRVSRQQRHIFGFLFALLAEQRREVVELGGYLALVVIRMYEKTLHPAKLRRVPAKSLMEFYDRNEELIGSLEGAHARFVEKILGAELTTQPFVTKYVMEALEESDDVALDEDEAAELFMILKTIVDALDDATRQPTAERKRRRG